jgi:hypothetical protein
MNRSELFREAAAVAVVDTAGRDGDHAAVPRLGRIVALVTIGVITVLAPLAYAHPPDPSWIDGFWDDDDYDGVVVMVLSAAGIVDIALTRCEPALSELASVRPVAARAAPGAVDDTATPRAPPRSLLA